MSWLKPTPKFVKMDRATVLALIDNTLNDPLTGRGFLTPRETLANVLLGQWRLQKSDAKPDGIDKDSMLALIDRVTGHPLSGRGFLSQRELLADVIIAEWTVRGPMGRPTPEPQLLFASPPVVPKVKASDADLTIPPAKTRAPAPDKVRSDTSSAPTGAAVAVGAR